MGKRFKKKSVIFSFLFLFYICGISYGQGFKITELPEDTSPTSDDLLLTVDSPATTPANKKVQIGNLPFVSSSGGTYTGDLNIGSTSSGKNLTVNATLGAELAPALTEGNWTIGAGWENPIVGPGLIKNADGTGTQTPSAATTIVAGVTYKVVITLSALTVGSASYTLGGVTGTSLAAATTYTDYITASTTGKFIVTPTNTSRFTISVVSYKALTDATGDLTVDGNLTVRSPSTFDGNITSGSGRTLTLQAGGTGTVGNLVFNPSGGKIITGHTTFFGNAGQGAIESHTGADIGGIQGFNWSSADTNREIAIFAKSANSTIGTHALVADNEYIGTFLWWGSDGGAFREVANMQVFIDGTPGVNDMPGRLSFGTTPDNDITAVERYRINNAGKHYWWFTSPGIAAGVTGNYEGLSLTLASGSATFAAETGGTGADNLDIVLTPAGTGGVQNSAANITVGAGTGITVNQSGSLNRQVYKVTTTYAAYSDVDTKKGIVIATLPAKTKLVGAYADTTAAYTGGAITATTLVVGVTAEDGAEIIASHSVFAGAVTKGLLDADMGTSMTRATQIQGGYLPSWTGTTAVYATITTTTANTDALTAGSTTFYLVTERF